MRARDSSVSKPRGSRYGADAYSTNAREAPPRCGRSPTEPRPGLDTAQTPTRPTRGGTPIRCGRSPTEPRPGLDTAQTPTRPTRGGTPIRCGRSPTEPRPGLDTAQTPTRPTRGRPPPAVAGLRPSHAPVSIRRRRLLDQRVGGPHSLWPVSDRATPWSRYGADAYSTTRIVPSHTASPAGCPSPAATGSRAPSTRPYSPTSSRYSPGGASAATGMR